MKLLDLILPNYFKMSNEQAKKEEFERSLKEFRKDAIKEGWTEDKLEDKIASTFESIPSENFTSSSTKRSRIGPILLYIFIGYLAFGALSTRSSKFNSVYHTVMFDMKVDYHMQRYLRFLTVPLFRFVDLGQYHERECIIENPFLKEEDIDCGFCDGLTKIEEVSVERNLTEVELYIDSAEPVVIRDVPHYHNASIDYEDLQQMFQEHSKELDEAICYINSEDHGFTKVSDYFKLSKQEVIERNISMAWTNCDTYGTRFYRNIFPKPIFIAADKEVYMEKKLYLLQPNFKIYNLDVNQDGPAYLIQAQGSSHFTLEPPPECYTNCTENPLTMDLNQGDVVVFTAGGYAPSLVTTGTEMSLIYLSKFSR